MDARVLRSKVKGQPAKYFYYKTVNRGFIHYNGKTYTMEFLLFMKNETESICEKEKSAWKDNTVQCLYFAGVSS